MVPMFGVEKSRRIVDGTRLPSSTPGGIPVEILEEILSHVTSVKEICQLEQVNKTFANICWKSIRTLSLDHICKHYYYELQGSNVKVLDVELSPRFDKQTIRKILSSVWMKSTNLRELHLLWTVGQHRCLDPAPANLIVSSLSALQQRSPRKISGLFLDEMFTRFAPCAALIQRFWSNDLKSLKIQGRLGINMEVNTNVVQAIGMCVKLEKVEVRRAKLGEQFPQFMEIVGTLKNLRFLEMTTLYRDFGEDDTFSLCEQLQKLAEWRNSRELSGDGHRKFVLKLNSCDFVAISKILRKTRDVLPLVTELQLSMSPTWKFQYSFKDICFQVCPSLEKCSFEADKDFDEYRMPIKIPRPQFDYSQPVVEYLKFFSASLDGKKNDCDFTLDKRGRYCLDGLFPRIRQGVVDALGSEEVVVDFREGGSVQDSSIKFTFGDAECTVRFV